MAEAASDLIAEGREATQRSSWQEAFELLQSADELEILDPSVLEDLARSAWWSGKPDDAIEARERAFAAYNRDHNSPSAARVALNLAEDHFHKTGTAVGTAWVKRAEQLLEGERSSPETAYLIRMKSVMAFEGDDDPTSGLKLSRRSHQLAIECGDLDLQAITLHDQGRMTVALGEVDEGMALLDEAMVAAVGGGLGAYATGKIYCNMIDICEQIADYRRAGDWSDAAKRWCERAGHNSGFPGVCRIHRAEIMRLRGDWKTAEEEAIRGCDELGNYPDFAGMAFYEIGEIRMHMGDFEEAEVAFRQAHGSGRDPQPGMALLELARDNLEGARDLINQSLADTSASLRRARLLPSQIKIALENGSLDVARLAADELQSIADEYGTTALQASAHDGAGSVLVAEGSPEDAVPRLRAAIDGWLRSDVPYETARSRMLLAQAYRDQGSSDLAELELRTALTAFEELGAVPDVRAARSALDVGRRSTPSERRVAALMFTDIVDSTALIGAIGDAAWEQLLRWHNRTLRSLFGSHDGREIDRAGDGFFVAFDLTQNAIDCAVDIQRTFATQRSEHGFAPAVRIGLHSGEVTGVGSGLAGQDVHRAARICAQASGSEILSSTDLVDLTSRSTPAADRRSIQLKGFEDPIEVTLIAWD